MRMILMTYALWSLLQAMLEMVRTANRYFMVSQTACLLPNYCCSQANNHHLC